MSSHDFREPTNDELWAQPPVTPAPVQPAQQLAPLPAMPPLVAPGLAVAPMPVAPPAVRQNGDRTHLALAIVSLALGIPLSAIGSYQMGIAGLIITWVGIVLVNFFYGRHHRS